MGIVKSQRVNVIYYQFCLQIFESILIFLSLFLILYLKDALNQTLLHSCLMFITFERFLMAFNNADRS